MKPRKPKSHGVFRHRVLDKYFSIVGACTTESGRCFVVRGLDGNPAERKFLIDGDIFDIFSTERDALFELLAAKEQARIKRAESNARAAERMEAGQHRREMDEIESDNVPLDEIEPDVFEVEEIAKPDTDTVRDEAVEFSYEDSSEQDEVEEAAAD